MLYYALSRNRSGEEMVTTVLERKQFTIDEYHRMTETGILRRDDRVELIEGEVIRMAPIGLRHAACVNRLNHLFNRLFSVERVIISIQNSLSVNETNDLQPDLAVLKHREDFYETKHPNADDALLVIEVADSSLNTDQTVKVPIYAKCRINELWILDLHTNSVYAYHSSDGSVFQANHQYHESDAISPQAFPAQSISVQSMFGTHTQEP